MLTEGIRVDVLQITMAKADDGRRLAVESHITNDCAMVTELHPVALWLAGQAVL